MHLRSVYLETPLPETPYNEPRNIRVLFDLPPIPHDTASTLRRFTPPTSSTQPMDIFNLALNGCTVPGYRFIRIDNERQMLMYIDGASSGNGTAKER